MRIDSPSERMRQSKAFSVLARYRTAAERLMIDALRAFLRERRAAARSLSRWL